MGSKQPKRQQNSFDLIRYSYFHNSLRSTQPAARPSQNNQKQVRKTNNKLILACAVCLVLLGFGFYTKIINKNKSVFTPQVQSAVTTFNRNLYSTTEPSSPWVIVNKQRPLPDSFVPANLRVPNMTLRLPAEDEEMMLAEPAAVALETLAAAAEKDGMSIMMGSGYRSIQRQTIVYETSIASIGVEETNKVSAVPGTSEHHTGLAVDLEETDRQCEFLPCFAATNLYKWLQQNAHLYGFILRYTEKNTAQTGYDFEPWHYRYVGKELATYLHNKPNESLESLFLEVK